MCHGSFCGADRASMGPLSVGGLIVRPLRASVVLVAVLVLAAACGTNSEDRARLASLKEDPLLTVNPPAGIAPGGPIRTSETLADSDRAVQGTVKTFYHVVYEIEPGVDHYQLLQDYGELLSELGWPNVRANCVNDFFVGAGRWTDGYRRVVGVSVASAGTSINGQERETDELRISFSAPFHSIDSEPPAEEFVDLSCLENPP